MADVIHEARYGDFSVEQGVPKWKGQSIPDLERRAKLGEDHMELDDEYRRERVLHQQAAIAEDALLRLADAVHHGQGPAMLATLQSEGLISEPRDQPRTKDPPDEPEPKDKPDEPDN